MQGDYPRAQIIALTATFIALITIGGWISIPFVPVPLTLQTLFVLLAAIVMKRYAVIPTSLYLFLGAMNLPLFHNGTSGIGILLGPTGGYLVGFIPASLAAGLAYERKSGVWNLAGITVAEVLIYGCGAGWLVLSAGLSALQAIIIGVLPFLPGELVKVYAAVQIGKRIPDRDTLHTGGNREGP